MKKPITLVILLCMLLWMTACGSKPSGQLETLPIETSSAERSDEVQDTEETAGPEQATEDETTEAGETVKEEQGSMLQMMIDDTVVQVEWENNDSVQALRKLCVNQPLTIQMSMYGGFEQVGAIGKKLPRNDKQTTTNAGDIVLYSGNQMVVFYGSNSWAYTRLGRITDKTASEMSELLGHADVTIKLSLGE